MTAGTVRSVLRLVAVVMIVIGIVFTSQVAVQLLGNEGSFGVRLVAVSVFMQLLPASWGIALYAASSWLAGRIVD
jgi:hypothetical protein